VRGRRVLERPGSVRLGFVGVRIGFGPCFGFGFS
jgi:hypothetical protein